MINVTKNQVISIVSELGVILNEEKYNIIEGIVNNYAELKKRSISEGEIRAIVIGYIEGTKK